MDDRADDISYDPRSWVAPRPAPSGSDTSFDPRSWPTARSVVAAPASEPPRAPWPIAAGAAIALMGAAAAYLARPAPPAETSTLAPAAAPTGSGVESRTLVVPGVGGLADSLLAVGVPAADAAAAARLTAARLGSGEGELRLAVAMAGVPGGRRLAGLEATRADGSGVALAADRRGGFDATPLTAKLTRRTMLVRGELDGESFYSSAVSAGVSDVLVGEFANAFRYDFDMQREVARGDVFEAGFEQRVTAEGRPVGPPALVYASLSTAGKSRSLYRDAPAGGGAAEWFDSGGRSSRRALMRTPVEAARISSGFGLRGHPILGFVKMHRGTDFAAPTGTPIFAAGDAVVTFAGPKGPNGNFVRLRHDSGWDTLYLHMNRIAPGLAPGVRVAQGQPIGEVGTTGRSTGPHLHYEVHIAGQAVDPLSIDTGSGRTLTGPALARFRAARDRIDARRAAGA